MSVVVRSPQTTVTVSHKGGTVVVSKPSNDIVVAPSITVPGTLGLVTGANVGGGDAEVFRDKIGTVLNFRTLSGLGGVAISENGDVVEVDGSALQTVLLSHATRHQHGGADEVATATPAANAIPKADGTGKLDSGWMPAGTFTLVAVSAADTTPGYLDAKVVAGAGLTSQILNPAGDEDLELNVVANADGSIVVNTDDIQVGVLASDAQHGDRGGGSVHALAIASGAAGFLSGADKQLIDDLDTAYAPIVHASTHAGVGSDPITSLGALAMTGTLDLDGQQLTIDVDGDSYWDHTIDDQVDLYFNSGLVNSFNASRTLGPSFEFPTGVNLSSPAAGVLLITETVEPSYLRLIFGAEDNLHPALIRNSDNLEIKKGDMSGRSGLIAEKVTISGINYFAWINRASLGAPADGYVRLYNKDFNGFTMLQFGGGGNTEPGWKKIGATFEARLADDSGPTSVTASDFDLSGGGSLATHASRHAGAGGDAITTLGAVTFTGIIDWTSATVINGLTDSKLLLTDTLGTSFDMIQLGGTTSADVAIKVNTTAPAPCVEARLADDSDSAYLRAKHMGLGTDPTAGHMLFGDEFFTGTGNKVGIGIFPAYIPSSLATQNLYGVQGNVFFGGTDWGTGSFVNALQFYPAPDYLNGATSWGSSALNLLGISTGGMINIFSRTVTANTVVGISVQTLAHIFGTPGAVSANSATALEVVTPSQTTGTIGVQTGIEIQPQLYGTLNQGLWMAGDGAGSDIIIGAGKDVRLYYDGTDLQLDTSVVAPSDLVLSCGTDKTLELAETVWDDLRVPLTAGRPGLTNPPSWSQYRDNGAASVGVYAHAFSDQGAAINEEELWFQVQLPHKWKEGTDIRPHIHWGIKTAGAAGEFVKWGLEFTWTNIDGTIGTTTIITSDASGASTATTSGDGTLAINKHYVTDIGTITGTGKTISSMLLCRVFRNSSHADDDLAQDAYGFEVDFHHELDTIGSRQILVK